MLQELYAACLCMVIFKILVCQSQGRYSVIWHYVQRLQTIILKKQSRFVSKAKLGQENDINLEQQKLEFFTENKDTLILESSQANSNSDFHSQFHHILTFYLDTNTHRTALNSRSLTRPTIVFFESIINFRNTISSRCV